MGGVLVAGTIHFFARKQPIGKYERFDLALPQHVGAVHPVNVILEIGAPRGAADVFEGSFCSCLLDVVECNCQQEINSFQMNMATALEPSDGIHAAIWH